MSTQSDAGPPTEDQIPMGQRLFDNWGLLMVAGILIMAVIYTGWGFWEILSLPEGRLP